MKEEGARDSLEDQNTWEEGDDDPGYKDSEDSSNTTQSGHADEVASLTSTPHCQLQLRCRSRSIPDQ
jgi:hypothetical protein